MQEPTSAVAGGQLLSIVQRVEHCHGEKRTIEDDIRDIYAEAKCTGFDVKAIKTIIKMRRADQEKLREENAIIETYLLAIGEAEHSARPSCAREDRSSTRQEAQAAPVP